MGYTGAADNNIVQLTDAGRALCARAALEGLSFVFDSWQIGRDGYLVSNPVQVLPVNPADTGLVDPIYPSATTRMSFITPGDFEFPTNRSVSCTVRVYRETVQANYALGEIGIWVKILNSPANPSENDTYVLFSIMHMPIQALTFNSAKVWRIIHNF